MPDKNLSRAGSRNTKRKFGEAPTLGRVSRSPLSAIPGGSRRRIRRKQKNSSARNFTLALSFVLILAMSALLFRHFRKRVAEANQAAIPEFLAAAAPQRKTADLPQLAEREAIAIVNAAFAGIAPDAVDDFFVLGPGDDPGKAINALQMIAENEGTLTECEWLGQKFSDGRMIAEVITRLDGADGSNRRLGQLVFGADGKWRIDLDSYLRKCIPDWPAILSGRSQRSLVRVFIGPDTYYNGPFSDEVKWQSFTMTSADVEGSLYAYVRRGSPQEKAMLKMLGSKVDFHPATLEIGPAADASTRQFEITGVLADGWVLSESRYDASF